MTLKQLSLVSIVLVYSGVLAADDSGQKRHSVRYDGKQITACHEYFTMNIGSQLCANVSKNGVCEQSTGALPGVGPVAGQGNLPGAYLYTEQAAYFVPFPPRPERYTKLVQDCVAKGYDKDFFCKDLVDEPRYMRVDLSNETPARSAILRFEPKDRTLTLVTLRTETFGKVYFKDGTLVGEPEKIGEGSETWPDGSRDVILRDIFDDIVVEGKDAQAGGQGMGRVATMLVNAAGGGGLVNPYKEEANLAESCESLFDPKSPEVGKIKKAVAQLRARSRKIDATNAYMAAEERKERELERAAKKNAK